MMSRTGKRTLVAFVLGIVASIILFWIMQFLISGQGGGANLEEGGRITDVIRVKADELTQLKQRRKPPPPPPPKKPPPPPKLTVSSQVKPQVQPLKIEVPNVSLGVSTGGGPYLGGFQSDAPPQEGDVIPIVRIQPRYPREALLDGTEGWVKLMLTIAPDGTVSGAKVLDASPRRVFDRAATRAVYKWKFKPRVVNGQAVSRQAEQTIEFSLDGAE